MKINKRSQLQLADILNEHGDEFIRSHKLCPDQVKAIHDIRSCRTAVLGGHIDKCNHCGHTQLSYNSCRNRHCNKCQYLKQVVWIEKLKSSLPPCRYFHIVFTIPSELHKVFYLNQSLCYDLLFKASAQAVQKAATNPRFLGAHTGGVSLLHTWGQTLAYHPHIHMIVPAGGLSEDHNEWVPSRKKFLLPVRVLSKIYRGIYWSKLEELINDERIRLPDGLNKDQLKHLVYKHEWNVYSKKSMASPHTVVQYLGRYTHRVAISNQRISSISDRKVTFKYKNYLKRGSAQTMTLEVMEFIRRFVSHILPTGFYKIRYTGILACCHTKLKEIVQQLIGQSQYISLLDGLSAAEVFAVLTGKTPHLCPECKIGMVEVVGEIQSG